MHQADNAPGSGGSAAPPPGLVRLVRILEMPTLVVANVAAWLILPMVLVLVYDVVLRYFLDSPVIWAYDVTYMLAGTLFMLGSAYALKNGAHVRADILFSHRAPRWQATIDVAIYLLGYFPVMFLFLWVSGEYALHSWQQQETYPLSPWMPIIYPFKTVMPVTVLLLIVQGLAELLKTGWTVKTNQRYPSQLEEH